MDAAAGVTVATDAFVSLVTGAASGLGRAMAIALLNDGGRVAAMDVEASRSSLDALVAEVAPAGAASRLLPIFGDVRSEGDCDRAISQTLEHFGEIHALINNAGLGMNYIRQHASKAEVAFYEVPPDSWRTLIETNVNGPFLMARAATPLFLEQRWGRIVNIGTGYEGMLRTRFTPYGPAKAALEAATLAWSKDLADTGVTVNVLLPGGAADTPQLTREAFPDRTTLLPTSVMADPIVWLVSRDSDGITGYRFIANRWDSMATGRQNLERAGAPAGWQSLV